MSQGALRPLTRKVVRLSPRRVLIVSEPGNDRRALAIALRVQGHTAHEASDAREALALAPHCDFAIVDARLDDMEGVALARALEAQDGGMRVLLAVDAAFPSLARLPSELRRTQVMPKPLEAGALTEFLAALPAH